MLTKKTRITNFRVDYTGGGQRVGYTESIDIFENGLFLGTLENKVSRLRGVGSNFSEFMGELGGNDGWDVGTTYPAGAVSNHLNEYWVALSETTGAAPDSSPLVWRMIPRPTETEILVEEIKQIAAIYLREDIVDEETPEIALSKIASIYPSWEAWKLVGVDTVHTYEGQFFRARITHVTQPDWTPDVAFSLWEEVRKSGSHVWVQPTGAHNSYPLGFIVTHAGKTWESLLNANVWVPGVGAQWIEVVVTPVGPQPWVQPTGGHDAYAAGATVTHNGQTWVSLVGSNVWEPGAVGTESLWSVV